MHGGAILAYIPSPPRGVWDVGPFPLRAYAICIIIGIIVAIWWGERRWRERGGEQGKVLDVAMFAVPFGLVGGRLYHVATDWEKYFGAGGHPINALKIWEGGLGIWGAVLLGGVGAWIGCRVYRIPLPAFGDAIAPAILLAQAIGRLGNYFNQELYGRKTDLPWGLEIYLRFDSDGRLDMMNGVSTGVVEKIVQPTFLYELIWNLLGVLVLVMVDKRWRIGHGRLFALYVAIYTFGRFWVELLRDDEATHIFGIRVNSYTSAIVFLCALAYFALATKGRETAAQLASGGERPWPWQWGALRRYGAAGQEAAAESAPAASAGESAAGEKSDEDAKTEKAAESESAPATSASGESGESTAGPSDSVKTGTEATGNELDPPADDKDAAGVTTAGNSDQRAEGESGKPGRKKADKS
ncbi:prolipoprotein diacylglyceryl transferase [Nocardia nova]|uniref:Phosphatidylglycerol--prolipoprotein diacylglyceryl transferase n=1 Tax=Nocardia nova TaxID=37330 RepID=A0A2S6A800_9NOCA|nr:prolipoprotein diacylglyceryl transferase [Nocardia nova]PPJ29158.1 prolipoprotein diacylglyceryl transferase [Nocardia nova]